MSQSERDDQKCQESTPSPTCPQNAKKDEWESFFESHEAPPGFASKKLRMHEFAQDHLKNGTNVVLVTSGGTAVPLESRVVRFIDNFSSGKRGASSAEYILSTNLLFKIYHYSFKLNIEKVIVQERSKQKSCF